VEACGPSGQGRQPEVLQLAGAHVIDERALRRAVACAAPVREREGRGVGRRVNGPYCRLEVQQGGGLKRGPRPLQQGMEKPGVPLGCGGPLIAERAPGYPLA
jgi:hypothetical protein